GKNVDGGGLDKSWSVVVDSKRLTSDEKDN
ncbi:unnamed protein product, partial [marine sediment metagenome]